MEFLPPAPKAGTSTNFATPAYSYIITPEAWGGIEPPYRDFADLCLTTWLPRLVKIVAE